MPEIPRPDRLTRDRAQVLIVDIQGKLLPHIFEHERVVAQTVRLIRGARELGLPLVVSEQYPQGLGQTHPDILAAAADARKLTKMTFSACQDGQARETLRSLARPQVLLVGIEAHVCVQQTALDLLADGLRPVVIADAVGSRRAIDRDVALDRMRSAGVVVTTVEAALFEMTHECGTDLFKRVLAIVR